MMRRLSALLAVTGVAVGCGDEGPTGVGGGLLPGGAVRTFELVLEPGEFLVEDTAFVGSAGPAGAGYMVLARDYGGDLDANGLIRLPLPPTEVEFSDTAGTTRRDTIQSFTGATLEIDIDTARSVAAGPVEVDVYRVAEAWDPVTATWTLRADTGTVEHAWADAGGTRGALLGSGTWSPGDSLVAIPVDSAAVALWEAGGDLERSVLIVTETPGTRLLTADLRIQFQARPEPRPETVVTVTRENGFFDTFVYQPMPDPGTGLRVGGAPAWRSVLRFREGLGAMELPCPGEAESGCVIRLTDATLSFAALQLQPVTVPAAFEPADSVRLTPRPLLVTDFAPLNRAPLGDYPTRRGEVVPQIAVAADRFAAAGSAGDPIELPITRFVEQLVAEPEPEGTEPSSTLAVLSAAEAGFGLGGTFGFGAFASGEAGAAAPRLRLIVTVATQVEIR